MNSQQLNLSDREIEIVSLLAEGLASKQIGSELEISKHTVDTHRRNLIMKTGCKNTMELVVRCVREGMV